MNSLFLSAAAITIQNLPSSPLLDVLQRELNGVGGVVHDVFDLRLGVLPELGEVLLLAFLRPLLAEALTIRQASAIGNGRGRCDYGSVNSQQEAGEGGVGVETMRSGFESSVRTPSSVSTVRGHCPSSLPEKLSHEAQEFESLEVLESLELQAT